MCPRGISKLKKSGSTQKKSFIEEYLMYNRTFIAPTSTPTGTVRVSPSAARSLALALATDQQTWNWEKEGYGPLSLPEAPSSLETAIAAADEFQDEGRFTNDGDASYWRPNVTTENGAVTWSPWSGDASRFIRIKADGTITWDTGTGRRSEFIGGCLVAAAGGLKNLHGVVKMETLRVAA
jgi:hypothetical protein